MEVKDNRYLAKSLELLKYAQILCNITSIQETISFLVTIGTNLLCQLASIGVIFLNLIVTPEALILATTFTVTVAISLFFFKKTTIAVATNYITPAVKLYYNALTTSPLITMAITHTMLSAFSFILTPYTSHGLVWLRLKLSDVLDQFDIIGIRHPKESIEQLENYKKNVEELTTTLLNLNTTATLYAEGKSENLNSVSEEILGIYQSEKNDIFRVAEKHVTDKFIVIEKILNYSYDVPRISSGLPNKTVDIIESLKL
jgi:hypothetical protein